MLIYLDAKDIHSTALVILVCVLAYFACIYIAIFFNVMLIAMVNDYLEQKSPSFAKGFSRAIHRAPAILVWTLITGTVGILIRMLSALEEKLHIPSILSAILDVGWAAATYFVVPIICFQGSTSPRALYDESAKLIRQT